MKTVVFILVGLALLAVVLMPAPAARRSRLALGFIAVWLVASGINFGIGLSHGYSVREELMVHLFLFGIPALAALACWWWQERIET